MKVHILSDLHLEFSDFVLPECEADLLVLAGDIGGGHLALEWLATQTIDMDVIYVPGNHEFYGHDLGLIDELKKNSPSNVYVLNNEWLEIFGIRFIGTTLWTDFGCFGDERKTHSMAYAKRCMADFSHITYQENLLTPADTIFLHQQSIQWLMDVLAEDFLGKTVVVSHHAPSVLSIHPRYADDLLTPAFVSDMSELVAHSDIFLWVHGHTHSAFDYEIGGTRVVCNPRGYIGYENNIGFDPELIVSI